MVNNEIIKEWISKADEDFEFALSNLKEGKTFFSQICFHFQQAAEKYLKSYYRQRTRFSKDPRPPPSPKNLLIERLFFR